MCLYDPCGRSSTQGVNTVCVCVTPVAGRPLKVYIILLYYDRVDDRYIDLKNTKQAHDACRCESLRLAP